MFELSSVLQPETCRQLEKDITGGTMSPCSLFYGPICSGRLTAAIEAGLALSGQTAADNFHPTNIAFASARDWQPEIGTALNLFSKQRNGVSKRFLIRSVSSMLYSYHPALYNDELPKTRRDAFQIAGEAAALLSEIETSVNPEDEDAVRKAVTHLSAKLTPLYKTNPLSVSAVRSVRTWLSSYAVDGKTAIIIIEGLETANEGARNALLKVLEEAPESSRFILLTNNVERVMPTILSRSRRYRFRTPSAESAAAVISSLFMNPKNYVSLEEFFIRESGIPFDAIKRAASVLMDSSEGGLLAEARTAVSELVSANQSEIVLKALSEEAEKRFIDGRWNRETAQRCSELIRRAAFGINSFNQTPKAAYEALMYALSDVKRREVKK